MSDNDPAAPAPRRRGRTWMWVAIGVVVLGALAAAGYFGYQTITARQAAEDQLDRAITYVERADAVVLDVDEIVRAEIDPELEQRAEEEIESIPGAEDDLNEAIALIERALPDLPESRRAEALALRGSAETRLDMLEPAVVILEANAMAARALGPADEGWDLVLEAEKHADTAVVEYNKLTDESVAKAKEITEQAQTTIREGRDMLQEAADAFPDADLAPFVEYADAKLDALAISQRANDAFLAGNNAQANELSKQYNAAESTLFEQAKELPASPAAQIAHAYEDKAGDATTEYFDARDRATEADAALNRAPEE